MGGGWGKNQKQFHARLNAKKKICAKKKIKKKIHAEGKSNCDFYLIYLKKLATVYKSSSHSENFWSLTPGPLLLTSKDI